MNILRVKHKYVRFCLINGTLFSVVSEKMMYPRAIVRYTNSQNMDKIGLYKS